MQEITCAKKVNSANRINYLDPNICLRIEINSACDFKNLMMFPAKSPDMYIDPLHGCRVIFIFFRSDKFDFCHLNILICFQQLKFWLWIIALLELYVSRLTSFKYLVRPLLRKNDHAHWCLVSFFK